MVALVINLEASKYNETNYNKVISTATHKRTKVKTHKTCIHNAGPSAGSLQFSMPANFCLF